MSFEIVRARGTLPGRATAVRANIDVDVGGQLMGRALAGLGGALAQEGLRYDLMEAAAQVSETRRKITERWNKLSLELQQNPDSTTYQPEYNKVMAEVKTYVPKNRRAARAIGLWVTDNTAAWQGALDKSIYARQKDTLEQENFNLRQVYIEQGGQVNYSNYLINLHQGYKLGAFTSEQVEMYLQKTISDRTRYAAAEGARLKREQKEALAEIQEKEATRLQLGIWDKSITDPKDIEESLRNKYITRTIAEHLRNALLSTEPVKVDLAVYSKALAMLNDYKGKPTKKGKEKVESFIIANNDKIDETRGIRLFEDIATAGDPKAALSTNRAQIRFGFLTQLWKDNVFSADESENSLIYDQKYEDLRNFFISKPDATAKEADEFYEDLVSDTTDSWLKKYWDWGGQVRGISYRYIKDKLLKGEKEITSPFPEYPDAFQLGGKWYVIRDGKRYRIEE